MAWRGLLARLAPASTAAGAHSSGAAAGALLAGRGGHSTGTVAAARLAAARGLSTNAVSEAAGSHHVDEPLEDVPRCVRGCVLGFYFVRQAVGWRRSLSACACTAARWSLAWLDWTLDSDRPFNPPTISSSCMHREMREVVSRKERIRMSPWKINLLTRQVRRRQGTAGDYERGHACIYRYIYQHIQSTSDRFNPIKSLFNRSAACRWWRR